MNDLLKRASQDLKFRRKLIRKLAMGPLAVSDDHIQRSRTYKYVLSQLHRVSSSQLQNLFRTFKVQGLEDLAIVIVREMMFSGKTLGDILSSKQASRNKQANQSKIVVNKVLDREFASHFYKLYKLMKDRKEYQNLLQQIKKRLIEELLVPRRVEHALNRFQNINERSDPSQIMNQLSKVADELKIRLPSGDF